MKTLATLFSIGAMFFIAACTEPVGPPPPRLEPTITSVTVAPPAMDVIVSGCQKFYAEVRGTNGFDSTVVWSLQGMGTLSPSGEYCAPALECSALVIARSTVDTTKADTAYVTVRYGIIAVTVTPDSAELDFGETIQFTATVSGTNQNASGSWSATNGTITSSGTYTAPSFAVEDKVVFISSVDLTKSDTSYVTVEKMEWLAFAGWDELVEPPLNRWTFDIYLVRLDGKKLTRLTSNPANEYHPDWSPDGSRIAFHRDGQGAIGVKLHVIVMDANGSNQSRISSDTLRAWIPDWSPDGTKLAVAFKSEDRAGIAVMNADGSNLTDLYSVPCVGGSCKVPSGPDWSPDGSQIAFTNVDGGIYVMEPGGGNLHRVSPIGILAGYPKWSPDGSKFVFWNSNGVYVIDTDGTNLRFLAEKSATPNWSPDGTQIVYVATESSWDPVTTGPVWPIYVMNADGSNRQLVWQKRNHHPWDVAWKP